MKLRNNNRAVIKDLARISSKNNKVRNWILTGAAALTVFLLFGAFSVVNGRIQAELTLTVRERGTLACITLPNGTKQQYEQIQELDYIEAVGRETHLEDWMTEEIIGECVVADEVSFRNLDLPAFTDLTGHYPKKSEEIMMPVRVLRQLGITQPKLGMEIPGDWNKEWKSDDYKKMFYLSGYYSEYADSLANLPKIYLSEKYVEEMGKDPYKKAVIRMLQKDTLSGKDAEEKLYDDIRTDYESQQFSAKDTPQYQVMETVVGGYLIACFCVLVILLSIYLLSFNVLSISMNREIRQYGLLKMVGTTNRQLMQMVYRQGASITWKGCLIGIGVSLLFIFTIFPKMLAKLYMANMGSTQGMRVFRPGILILAVCFAVITMFTAIGTAARKVKKLSEIEAIRYIEKPAAIHKKTREAKQGTSLFHMAWRNVTRSRRRFVIVILSLFIGMEMAAGAVMITVGTDVRNEIEQNPDFEITNSYSIWGFHGYATDMITEDEPIQAGEIGYLPQSLVDEIENMEGVETTNRIQGSYAAVIDYPDERIDPALAPRLKALSGTEYYNCYATIQIVGDSDIKKLEKYVDKNQLKIDMESLKNGTGTILLHDHVMSPELQTEAEAAIGLPIHFRFIEGLYYNFGNGWWYDDLGWWPEGSGSDLKGYRKAALNSCGYLDIQEKGFPDLPMTWIGKETNYFIMSEKAFQTLGMEKRVFGEHLNVEKKKEPEIKKNLEHLLQKANQKDKKFYRDTEVYNLVSKSDILAAEKGKIDATRYVMMVLVSLLIFAGVMNYMNTMLTGIASRQRELAVMESIGMTRKQLGCMLFYEGICYMLCTAFLLFTLGYALLSGIGRLIKENLPYFRFCYPWESMIFMLILFFLLCIGIAFYSWKQYGRTDLVNILRRNTD